MCTEYGVDRYKAAPSKQRKMVWRFKFSCNRFNTVTLKGKSYRVPDQIEFIPQHKSTFSKVTEIMETSSSSSESFGLDVAASGIIQGIKLYFSKSHQESEALFEKRDTFTFEQNAIITTDKVQMENKEKICLDENFKERPNNFSGDYWNETDLYNDFS